MATEISVIVCTRNRAELLRDAVTSATTQTLAAERYEVIVVDNGSSDGTAAVVGELAGAAPNVRYVREPVVGLSAARNRGVAEASSPLVVFLDDDAVAEPQWLEAYQRVFTGHDAPAAAGGPIRLVWPNGRPAWLPRQFEGFYSGLERGAELCPVVFPDIPYGANMAIRRDVLVAVGGFPVALGRSGTALTSGEEREVFRRVAASGGTCVYVPDAVVHHRVLPDRVRRGWLMRRAFAQGRSELLLATMERSRMRRIGFAARSVHRAGRAVGQAAFAAWAVATRQPPERAMHRLARASQALGAAAECGRFAIDGRRRW
jgi:glycosyltransferase involved in cell wall biosynthesis